LLIDPIDRRVHNNDVTGSIHFRYNRFRDRIQSLDGKTRILLPRKSAVPSIGEVKEGHVKHEHRVVTLSGAAPRTFRQPRFRVGLNLLKFHCGNFVLPKLGNLASRHHEAVGGFLDASQGRADNTSFEGVNKSGVPWK
jgi:hypothetical protein